MCSLGIKFKSDFLKIFRWIYKFQKLLKIFCRSLDKSINTENISKVQVNFFDGYYWRRQVTPINTAANLNSNQNHINSLRVTVPKYNQILIYDKDISLQVEFHLHDDHILYSEVEKIVLYLDKRRRSYSQISYKESSSEHESDSENYDSNNTRKRRKYSYRDRSSSIKSKRARTPKVSTKTVTEYKCDAEMSKLLGELGITMHLIVLRCRKG